MSSMQKVAMRKRTIPAVLSTLTVLGARARSGRLRVIWRRQRSHARGLLDATGGLHLADTGVQCHKRRQRSHFQPVLRTLWRTESVVAAGLKADVVNFSLEPDVTRLVKARLVSSDWNKNATHGFVTNSVAVIIVRKGNPKHITGWSDLAKPGIQVVTPNPFTSGSARWNILAAYGARSRKARPPPQAQAYLQTLFHKVVSQDSSARNALQTFLAGSGDALIDYEDEAITDKKKGSAIEYVIPRPRS